MGGSVRTHRAVENRSVGLMIQLLYARASSVVKRCADIKTRVRISHLTIITTMIELQKKLWCTKAKSRFESSNTYLMGKSLKLETSVLMELESRHLRSGLKLDVTAYASYTNHVSIMTK